MIEKKESAVQIYNGAAPYAFISYAEADIADVEPVLQTLADCGYRLWYDKGLIPGADWAKTIEQKIAKSALYIVFISSKANKSIHVDAELGIARDLVNLPKVPIYLEDLRANEGRRGYLELVQG